MGEEGQERIPETSTLLPTISVLYLLYLLDLLYQCYVTREEDKLKDRLAADIELIYYHLPFHYYTK